MGRSELNVGDVVRPVDGCADDRMVVTEFSAGTKSVFKAGGTWWTRDNVEPASPAPSLSREDLAARFAVALACGDIASDQPERAPVDVVASRSFEYADAFLAALSSKPALAPPPAATKGGAS